MRGLNAPLQSPPQHLLRCCKACRSRVAFAPFHGARLRPSSIKGDVPYQAVRQVVDWPVPDPVAAFGDIVLVGSTAVHFRDVAAAAFNKWNEMEAVSMVVLAQGAPRGQCSVERLLHTLNLSRADSELGTPGTTGQPAAGGLVPPMHHGTGAEAGVGPAAFPFADRRPPPRMWMAKSLLSVGGFWCVGRTERWCFACPVAVLFQMQKLEEHR